MLRRNISHALGAIASIMLASCSRSVPPPRAPVPATLARQCAEVAGVPRVIQVTPRVLVATGYDLANVILLRTSAGNVIVDSGMSPQRARAMREALLGSSPGPIRALIFTHSHIDHVGGASVFADPGTEIWATRSFREGFLEQYGLFRESELRRGGRQFGEGVPEEALPCSSIGRRPDLSSARRSGARMPTHTFAGKKTLLFGDLSLDLVEAPGETRDHLFVHIPAEETLLPGDAFYRAFPNLYTIRGTSPRPISEWIASLDRMRRLAPMHLVPSHTTPISGRDHVRQALTEYRDAISFVRDQTVRAANRGEAVEALARRITLPPHLVESPYLRELYGQVDWSARAVYGNHLGWFDGRPEDLYPLAPAERARREVMLMGGVARVLGEAAAARAKGEHRFALSLLAKLRDMGGLTKQERERLAEELRSTLSSLAAGVENSNGRAYLLASAREIEGAPPAPALPQPDDVLLSQVPLRVFFDLMALRLIPERTLDTHESVLFVFPDEGGASGSRFTLTVRRGVAEVVEGDPLPGTPAPLASLTTHGMTWRRLALRREGVIGAFLGGKVKISGSRIGLARFLSLFARDPQETGVF